MFFLAFLRWIKFCSGCFRQAFFSFGRQKKCWLFALDRRSSCTVTIVWEFAWVESGLVVLQRRSFEQFEQHWVQMFKYIISHSSTKFLLPPLHNFTIRYLDLIFSLFWELNSLNIALYLLTCQYFGRMEKNLIRRNVWLRFANFSWFELRRYAMKGKSEGNF